MGLFVVFVVALVSAGCSGGGGTAGAPDDGSGPEAESPDVAATDESTGPEPDVTPPDVVDATPDEEEATAPDLVAEETDDAPPETVEEDAPFVYTRGSLASCLLDPACRRVAVTSHMGAWSALLPGNSMAAYRRAWELGADAIEGDVRVSRDGVPFMIHDDTITLYQSVLCAGRVISESDASDIDGCLLAPSLTETIPTFAEFAEWARSKILIHLDVKASAAVATMVAEINARSAQDFVFIAVSTGEVASLIGSIPGSSSVQFLMRVGSVANIDAALGALRRPNVFMLEGDRTWDSPPVDEAAMIVQVARVQAAGLRIMASSDTYLATLANHLRLYEMGFDNVLSYNCENGVAAARQVNIARGYSP